MTQPDDNMRELFELLWTVRDGSYQSEDIARLEQLAGDDPDMHKVCARFAVMCGLLHWSRRRPGDSRIPPPVAVIAHPDASPPLGFLASAMHGALGYFSSGWPMAYFVATVICGVGALVGAFMHVSQPVQVARKSAIRYPLSTIHSPFVGRITGMVDCQWSDPNTAVPGTVAVPLGRKYALSSGLMEITYDSGAKVILQGPCTYEVESAAGGYLSLGKLTAKIEKKEDTDSPRPSDGRGAGGEGGEKSGDRNESQRALTLALSQGERGPGSRSSFLVPHSYFAVRTPTATVTDLGTEFGVEVTEEGNTTSHVFRGLVRVQTTSAVGTSEGVNRILHENESACVEYVGDPSGENRLTTPSPQAKQADFVRVLPKATIKTLDLVDVLAGGDGFSGRRNRGIDPTTGRITGIQPDNRDLQGEYQYHRVDGIPMVDGVFIPDGSKGPVQIDSAGHVFPDCPTTDNCSWAYIWAGGKLPEGVAMLMSATLAGVDYSSPEHAVLTMHANKGITFDLDAVRRGNPDCEVLRFRAVTGNTEPLSRDGAVVSADIWVLVDGEVRFRRREFNYYSGAAPVVLPLHAKDRFLTLAVTDSGNSFRADQVIFGDPQVEMASRSKTK